MMQFFVRLSANRFPEIAAVLNKERAWVGLRKSLRPVAISTPFYGLDKLIQQVLRGLLNRRRVGPRKRLIGKAAIAVPVR